MSSTAALVVDDDDSIRRLIASLLRRAGFAPVHTACDGQEGLDLMAVHAYCVVILDLRMPRVSGYDVLDQLAANPLPRMPKIVVATADRSAVEHNLSADVVTAIITKPFDVETLISAALSCLDTD
jgi:two-component system, chemotaxis family, chemotaxis protein CheY